MNKIGESVGDQAYEVLRDRVAMILAAELNIQYVYTYDDLFNQVRVYVERFKPFDHSELPAINVSFPQYDLDSFDARGQVGMFTFFIDVYTKAKATKSDPGDNLAVVLNQKLAGKCKAILMHSAYRMLGFETGFVGSRRVSQIRFNNPSSEDKWSTATGRITLEVKAADIAGLSTGELLKEFSTIVKLYQTDKGYHYFGSPNEDAGFNYYLNQIL